MVPPINRLHGVSPDQGRSLTKIMTESTDNKVQTVAGTLREIFSFKPG